MCEVPGLGIDIPSPLAVARGVAGHPRAVAGLAGGTAVVVFILANAVIVGAAAVVFLGVMGTIVWRMRRPDWVPPQQAQAAVPALPRNLAITAGPRAIEAPRAVLPGQVLTAAESERMR